MHTPQKGPRDLRRTYTVNPRVRRLHFIRSRVHAPGLREHTTINVLFETEGAKTPQSSSNKNRIARRTALQRKVRQKLYMPIFLNKLLQRCQREKPAQTSLSLGMLLLISVERYEMHRNENM